MLNTSASGLGFQHLPWDLANVNAWKTMFDPYIKGLYDKQNLTLMVISYEIYETRRRLDS